MSSLRPNPYPLPDLLASLEQLQQRQNTASLQLATGSKINQPSDDPAGAAQVVQIHDTSSQVDAFEQSISSITGLLSTADSTLGSVVTTMQRALSLGVEGANGTLSDSDRAAIVNELTGIQSQLVSLANVSYQGNFVFSGTAETQPFVVDASAPSGVRYAGNSGTNQVAIGNGYNLQVNLPGAQVFQGAANDMFQSIHDLITALQDNSGIPAAVTEVGNASNYITVQRVFYGNGLNQTGNQQTYLDSTKVQLAQQENTVAGADIAAVATQFTADQTAATAALTSLSRISQESTLFDYLK
jgi:flagellar hook-associated protein 3 FlgL